MPGKTNTRLSELSPEQLKDLLQMELMSDSTDVEWIRQITAALDASSEKKAERDVDRAWADFVQDYASSQPLYSDVPVSDPTSLSAKGGRKRSIFRRLAGGIAAAALLVALSITASALGYDLWGAVVQWTSEVFSFGSEDAPLPDHYPEALEALHTAMDEDGITEPVLPTWLPDGYTLEDFSSYNVYKDTFCYTCVLSNQSGRSIIFEYICYRKPDSQYQKNAENPEIYKAGGIEHYIMFNQDEYLISWINGRVECSILGLLNKQDVYKLLDSIYTGGT